MFSFNLFATRGADNLSHHKDAERVDCEVCWLDGSASGGSTGIVRTFQSQRKALIFR